MRIRTAALVACVVLAPVGTGQAQLSNPLRFTLFGGAALPMDKTSDLVKTGFTVGGALDYKLPVLPFGLRAEVMYSGFDARTRSVLSAVRVWTISSRRPRQKYSSPAPAL